MDLPPSRIWIRSEELDDNKPPIISAVIYTQKPSEDSYQFALVAKPPETPVVAREIAKDVVNELLNVPRFIRNPEDTIIEIENKVAAIITRNLAATPSPETPHCWHCGVVLAYAPKLRCEECPDECDTEGCDEMGCAPAPVVADGDDEEQKNASRVTPEIAAKLIHLRDTLAKMESSELVNEAWHTLYSIADPEIASFFPWVELERLAALRTPVEGEK